MSSLRDQRQKEFADIWLYKRWGVIYVCPRAGKTRIATIALSNFPSDISVLIAYPDIKIKKSWEDEFIKVGYENPNVTFTTHLSLKKYINNEYDVVIIDEIHSLSSAQIEACKELFAYNIQVMGLTGTLSVWTEKTLLKELSLPVIARYPIEQAIEEGVITDYEITVFKVPLDTTVLQQVTKRWKTTEKKYFNWLSSMIIKMEDEGKDTFHFRLKRMRVIQNSVAKLKKTKELLERHKDERVLVFTGVTKIADSLGIPSYHSKSSEKQIFQDFVDGQGKHLAVVRMANTGVTFMPLDRVIINYFDSNSENLTQKINRATSFEYNNPEKKAKIYIVSTTEPVEDNWLKKALSMFNKDKIKYV